MKSLHPTDKNPYIPAQTKRNTVHFGGTKGRLTNLLNNVNRKSKDVLYVKIQPHRFVKLTFKSLSQLDPKFKNLSVCSSSVRGTGRSQLPGIPQSRRVTLGTTFTRSKIRLTLAVRIRASPRIVIFLTHKFKA